MTRVLLLCHGAHDLAGRVITGRGSGVSLNMLGRHQAQAFAATWSAQSPLQAIYASPQPIACEFAASAAERLGLSLRMAPEFDDIDFGQWTGRRIDELRQQDGLRWQQWTDFRSQAAAPEGESFVEVVHRTQAGLARLRQLHPGQAVLVVSHTDVIKAAISGLLGLPLDAVDRLEVGPACVSAVEVSEGAGRLLLLNALVGG